MGEARLCPGEAAVHVEEGRGDSRTGICERTLLSNVDVRLVQQWISARLGDEEWQELLAERAAPMKGRGTPANIIRNPIKEPSMVRIKDGA